MDNILGESEGIVVGESVGDIVGNGVDKDE